MIEWPAEAASATGTSEAVSTNRRRLLRTAFEDELQQALSVLCPGLPGTPCLQRGCEFGGGDRFVDGRGGRARQREAALAKEGRWPLTFTIPWK
jgi:hypothetical protein